MRVSNDENMPPDGTTHRTIHQRNKSSPALTMGPGGAGLKACAKRTAFGDVSNIVAGARLSKDDSTCSHKQGLQLAVKPVEAINERKSAAALLRPAQRPVSVSNLKSFLTRVHPNSELESIVKLVPQDTEALHQPANTRKVLNKRSTNIFKDIQVTAGQENEPIKLRPRSSTAEPRDKEVRDLIDLAPLNQLRLPLPDFVDAPVEPIKEACRLDSESRASDIHQVTQETAWPHDAGDKGDIKAEGDDLEMKAGQQESTSSGLVPKQADAVSATVHILETQAVAMIEGLNPPEVMVPLNPPDAYQPRRSEPEEYWDEDEGDHDGGEGEEEEEEGYVTARSFRSRGDNTTGGMTTILFPQMNQRTRKELSAAKRLVEATRTLEEIEDESYDTSMVAEYGDEIFEYMRQLEVKMLPNAHYMDNQHEIQWSMRSVLMDWLVQVHHRFNLLPETLFLCANYIDRFLSCKVVSLGKLQLVGATAIFIAAKYEEINCPSVQEIVYMVDGGYTIDEILKAERFMLTMLQFELGWPGPMSFLRRISKADDYDLETRTLAKYFLEVTLMDERFIGSPPSFVAAASHCLSRLMLRKGSWVSDAMAYEINIQ